MTPDQGTPVDDWVGTTYAAERLGVSRVTIWRATPYLPHLRVGRGIRLPREFVEDARRAVMAGQAVVLHEFARDWSAQHQAEAVA